MDVVQQWKINVHVSVVVCLLIHNEVIVDILY